MDDDLESRWWRRRRRPARRWPWQEASPGPCGFCGRPHEECARLIAGPGVYICDRCVALASRPEGSPADEVGADTPLTVEPSGSGARCGFCGKDGAQVRRVVTGVASAPGGKVGGSPRICDECLALCEEILAETAPP